MDYKMAQAETGRGKRSCHSLLLSPIKWKRHFDVQNRIVDKVEEKSGLMRYHTITKMCIAIPITVPSKVR